MNAHATQSSAHDFVVTLFEILKALFRGLGRAVAYASCATDASPSGLPSTSEDNPSLDYLRLCSAFDHLTRAKPVLENFLGEPYINRVNHANPAMLERLLEENGYTMADVERWCALYPAAAS